ncbi:hypothetical protein [Psychrobacillus sp. L4]|uniref:hypothetical protein n=1 Tax=Psychrobacillus sp. L4 TaxID=3236892 RepID=UPI0036F2B094
MTSSGLSQYKQAKIVEKLTSNLDETDIEADFDEESYNQLDDAHKIQVDDAIREFADDAVGSEHWDSDE